MKQTVILVVAKSLIFATVSLWILGFLAVAFLLFFQFTALFEVNPVLLYLFQIWYIFTTVMIAVSVTLFGFRQVGSWTNKPEKESE